MKEREPRRRVLVKARMRLGNDWSDVSIQNVSSRGLMARAGGAAPQQGAYIEIRKATIVIVARAVWVKGQMFGVRTQDSLDIEGLLQSAADQNKQVANRGAGKVERRDPQRLASDIAARTERSRALARSMQFIVFVGVIGVAGWLLVDALSGALASPLAVVRSALAGG
ncbi:conserved hypothetical protein [Sphingomonas sp. EC-HK361]|uniref:PilZ domain-containing protein n=1 Tax=Sphingomonas sp. EC-HK361 TaxID=2038397 RepID=UPI0012511BEE|nr:PilZ domain-containing protein [Sphingomonas sp. EC-HK361]VVT25106.1 conserved hypothetical protein [Sphingomonas sp. EC-HK361]